MDFEGNLADPGVRNALRGISEEFELFETVRKLLGGIIMNSSELLLYKNPENREVFDCMLRIASEEFEGLDVKKTAGRIVSHILEVSEKWDLTEIYGRTILHISCK